VGAGRCELTSKLDAKVEQYLNQAEELRALAATMKSTEPRELLLKIADEFTAMANGLNKVRDRER